MNRPAPPRRITSARNQVVLDAARLGTSQERRRTGRTLLEGPTLLADALRAGAIVETVFASDDDLEAVTMAATAGAAAYLVTSEILEKLATTRHPQSPVAVVVVPPSTATAGGRALVAWQVGDPGNCGSLIRSAAAFGFDYLAGPGSADTWSPKVLRAAAGGHFRTGVGSVATLEQVGEGRTLVATVARGGTAPHRLPDNAAILVGSEPHGLPDPVVSACAMSITIPMTSGIESLNAAVAGAIVAFLGAQGPGANLASR